ncbi:hypothetical protein ACJX0J_038492, partial [Zea mays]
HKNIRKSIEMKRYGRFRNSYLHNLHQWIGLPFDFNFIVLDPILNILSFNKHTHKHWFARKGCLYVIIEISTTAVLATLGLVDVSCGACLTWKAALTSMHLSLEGQQEHYVHVPSTNKIESCLYTGTYQNYFHQCLIPRGVVVCLTQILVCVSVCLDHYRFKKY